MLDEYRTLWTLFNSGMKLNIHPNLSSRFHTTLRHIFADMRICMHKKAGFLLQTLDNL
jgi:hypothetical protein